MDKCTLCGRFHDSMLDCPEIREAKGGVHPKIKEIYDYQLIPLIRRNTPFNPPKCSICGGDHHKTDCYKKIMEEITLVCVNCGGSGHKARNCPRGSGEIRSPYVFSENSSPFIKQFTESCPECHSRGEGHFPGCSRETLMAHITQETLARMRGLEKFGPRAAQTTNVMQTYQSLRLQIEEKYLGQAMPPRLRDALDVIGEELSDRLMRDARNIPPLKRTTNYFNP